MTSVSLLGIPHDENSSYMRGAADAPPLIRRELFSDAYSSFSETGVDLGAPGRIVDHGDIAFDAGADAWDVIEQQVARIEVLKQDGHDVGRFVDVLTTLEQSQAALRSLRDSIESAIRAYAAHEA